MGCTALTIKVGAGALQADGMGCRVAGEQGEANLQSGSRSLHHGGVNVLFADGSAHFIANEIDELTWHGLHTRNGSENVAAF